MLSSLGNTRDKTIEFFPWAHTSAFSISIAHSPIILEMDRLWHVCIWTMHTELMRVIFKWMEKQLDIDPHLTVFWQKGIWISQFYYVNGNINTDSKGPQRPSEMAKNVFIDH